MRDSAPEYVNGIHWLIESQSIFRKSAFELSMKKVIMLTLAHKRASSNPFGSDRYPNLQQLLELVMPKEIQIT
jgi:hypothetical protein